MSLTPVCLCLCLSVCLSQCVCLSICLCVSVWSCCGQFIHCCLVLPVNLLSVCLSVSVCVYQLVYMSVCVCVVMYYVQFSVIIHCYPVPWVNLLSVCLSDKRVNCDKTKETSAHILTAYDRSMSLFCDTKNGWWGTARGRSHSTWNFGPNWPIPCKVGDFQSTGWTQKSSPPLRLLVIFQLWVQIFAWNFTWLSNNQTYTLSLSLVEIYRKMTELCCFSQGNPHFSLCERHAELTECEQVHWEDWVALKLSRFEPTGLTHLGHHAGKVP